MSSNTSGSGVSSPLTQQRATQFRGPSTSDDYNSRIQENYGDIVTLYNRANIAQQQDTEIYGRFVKDGFGMEQMITGLQSQILNLRSATPGVSYQTFANTNQIDNALFANSSYAIPATVQLTVDAQHGYMTLPQVPTASVSKLAFTDPTTGVVSLPSTLNTTVTQVPGSADDPSIATIVTSPPALAIARQVGRVWQRNVVVSSPVTGGAQCKLYIQCPQNLYTTANSNTLLLHPFPVFGSSILEVAYTTNTNPTMTDADGYVDFPNLFTDNQLAVGWVPPGSWGDGSDSDINAGFRVYYFDPVPITGLRVTLAQPNYFQENGNYVYSYGASLIDLQYTKFLSAGQAMVRVDAPNGATISNVSNVQPEIYNTSLAQQPNVFSYKVIWETAYKSGIYTETPVSYSKRCWILISLSATANQGSPALSGLTVQYS